MEGEKALRPVVSDIIVVVSQFFALVEDRCAYMGSNYNPRSESDTEETFFRPFFLGFAVASSWRNWKR